MAINRIESVKTMNHAKAAVALGGGIWSMHFVAMLALSLPVVIYYDALFTLGSALIAILITGLGLSLMHFGERNFHKTAGAGALIGLGIASMHYVGMEAIMGNCIVSYSPFGFIIPIAIAILFSICALSLAYHQRNPTQLGLGSILLGVTISGMHYSAMAFTGFLKVEAAVPTLKPLLADSYLALFVAVAAFLVCGVFLLTSLPLGGYRDVEAIHEDATPSVDPTMGLNGDVTDAAPAPAPTGSVRIPYERNNRTYFLDVERIRAIKADGHYTQIFDGENAHFCPWSISRIEEHLDGLPFMRTHRSFLLNLVHAEGFERRKDKAFVIVNGPAETEIPVSRSHVGEVLRALGA